LSPSSAPLTVIPTLCSMRVRKRTNQPFTNLRRSPNSFDRRIAFFFLFWRRKLSIATATAKPPPVGCWCVFIIFAAMAFTVSFLLCAVYAIAGALALAQAIVKIPLPQKWVWIVGFGILAANGIANALYQYGGIYIVLLPALYPLQALLSSLLFLSVLCAPSHTLLPPSLPPSLGCSRDNRHSRTCDRCLQCDESRSDQLPLVFPPNRCVLSKTPLEMILPLLGCTPIAMLAQYFPTYFVQIGFVALLVVFILVKYLLLLHLLAPLTRAVLLPHPVGPPQASLGFCLSLCSSPLLWCPSSASRLLSSQALTSQSSS
jgi:hypothetical protein